ncbi:hypothetical protein [Streptomyces botrytidirepellens]|uniref:Uncharacterized protein n=1 Tax=Streptomyces botrytidirepellens TaxID=2486417 RepID=A0A3M8WBQ0_9ACTN|nr:hypothetical protein [Streptomyces botrytidirepellens]RNG26977.1 hypothetical protein EEJ42_13970 [Streptomyces botrytidirepellens]
MSAVPPQETPVEPFDLGKELRALALATAPRLFAVARIHPYEDTDEVDVEIAAWGMDYGDGCTEVIGLGQRLVLSSPERVEAWFSRGAVTAQLVWLMPSTTASLDPGLAA